MGMHSDTPLVSLYFYSSLAQSVERVTVNHDVAGSRPAGGAKKKHLRKQVLFQLNPPMAEEIHLRWMKSLRDEICLSAGDGGGFNFI